MLARFKLERRRMKGISCETVLLIKQFKTVSREILTKETDICEETETNE
jgi:hypothetical protein